MPTQLLLKSKTQTALEVMAERHVPTPPLLGPIWLLYVLWLIPAAHVASINIARGIVYMSFGGNLILTLGRYHLRLSQ